MSQMTVPTEMRYGTSVYHAQKSEETRIKRGFCGGLCLYRPIEKGELGTACTSLSKQALGVLLLRWYAWLYWGWLVQNVGAARPAAVIRADGGRPCPWGVPP